MKNTDGMLCALRSDLFKLIRHKSVWIGMAIIFALILIVFCMVWIGLKIITGVEIGDDLEAAATQVQATEMLIMLEKSLLYGHGNVCSLSLFVAIITCLFVGKDFSNGAVRLCVSRGANRTQLFISKWISLATVVVMYSLFALLVCGIFSSFNSLGNPFTAQDFGILMRCFILQLLCNLSTMSMVLMLAFLFRSSGASLGATIGAGIAVSIIFSLISTIGSLNGDTSWVMFMPLQQIDVAASSDALSTTQLCAVIIMPIVYGVIATSIALSTFLKRDIK